MLQSDGHMWMHECGEVCDRAQSMHWVYKVLDLDLTPSLFLFSSLPSTLFLARAAVSHFLAQCCGRVLYDPAKEHCCNGVPQKAVDGRTGCLQASVQPLPRIIVGGISGMCSQRGVHCCGQQEYDPIRHICCQRRRYSKLFTWRLTILLSGLQITLGQTFS